MTVSIYSIPHTGTRFVSEFLRHQGAEYYRGHVGDMIKTDRLVCPVRNPFDCYLSHRFNNPPQTDVEFVALWGRFIYETSKRECYYVPLDAPDRLRTMNGLLAFCGCPLVKEVDWTPVGPSGRDRTLVVPAEMVTALDFAYAWYKDRTSESVGD